MSNLNKAAQAFFDKNKNTDTVFVTVDGTTFTTKNYADLHAASLKKRTVSEFSRTDFVKKTVSTSKPATKPAAPKSKTPKGSKTNPEFRDSNSSDGGQTTVAPKDELKTDYREVIALLEATDDLDVVKAYEDAENALDKPRKSVLETIAAKTEDLTKDA